MRAPGGGGEKGGEGVGGFVWLGVWGEGGRVTRGHTPYPSPVGLKRPVQRRMMPENTDGKSCKCICLSVVLWGTADAENKGPFLLMTYRDFHSVCLSLSSPLSLIAWSRSDYSFVCFP